MVHSASKNMVVVLVWYLVNCIKAVRRHLVKAILPLHLLTLLLLCHMAHWLSLGSAVSVDQGHLQTKFL